MILQNVVFGIAMAGILIIAIGFYFVISNAKVHADDAQTRHNSHQSHVLQAWWFGILLVAFVVGSWVTLHKLPIPPQHQPLAHSQTVDVVGHQWFWQMKPSTVKTGSVVEFRVTSADVNHDFAVYAPDGRIVTQVQAMPGYTNKMLYTFTEPGDYTIQCLEYCGVGHAPMHTILHVVNAAAVATGAGAAAGATQTAAAKPAAPDGAQIFTSNCAACHQATGTGIPGTFPPLKGNKAVNDPDPTQQIHVILHGFSGHAVDGKKYGGTMPPFGDVLNDDQIAAVINHERSSWGNNGKHVTAAQVAAVRASGK